jgi:hypothetical protein
MFLGKSGWKALVTMSPSTSTPPMTSIFRSKLLLLVVFGLDILRYPLMAPLESLGERDILITFKGTITNSKSLGNLMSSKWLQPPPMLIEHNLFHPRCHWGLSHHPRGSVMGGQSPTDFHYVLFFIFLFFLKKKGFFSNFGSILVRSYVLSPN